MHGIAYYSLGLLHVVVTCSVGNEGRQYFGTLNRNPHHLLQVSRCFCCVGLARNSIAPEAIKNLSYRVVSVRRRVALRNVNWIYALGNFRPHKVGFILIDETCRTKRLNVLIADVANTKWDLVGKEI
jgi:hypothetical protein